MIPEPTSPMQRMALTGAELLAEIAKHPSDTPKDELARLCGYVAAKKDGSERILYSDFYDALLQAKGLALAPPAKAKRAGRELSFVARVQKTGGVILSAGYLAKQEFNPGDEFKIEELEGGGFQLVPLAMA